MSSLAYTRYELLRVLRAPRFFIFSLGFPLVMYFLFAAPNRNEHDLNGSGLSAPLFYMVGLAAFGTMAAVLSSGARIAGERSVGWNRQLRLTPLSVRAYFRAKIVTAYAMALSSILLLDLAGTVARRAPLGRPLDLDDRADARRADPVRGARDPRRAPADARHDRPRHGWEHGALRVPRRRLVPDRPPRRALPDRAAPAVATGSCRRATSPSAARAWPTEGWLVIAGWAVVAAAARRLGLPPRHPARLTVRSTRLRHDPAMREPRLWDVIRVRLGVAIGLLFLIGPIADLADEGLGTLRTALIGAGTALFVVVYAMLLPGARVLHRLGRAHVWGPLATLPALALAVLALGAPRSFATLFVYVVAAAGIRLPAASRRSR